MANEKTFTVSWVIDLDATDPVQAARQALEIMQDPQSTAQVFRCLSHGSLEEVNVDLLDPDSVKAAMSGWEE